ncbi:hypothetical protein SAMN05421856_1241 [Chryseobacterium taichungense]|uniref:Uncharacterized protein n=1 Tax=Chryseobacterium taichungense TaxID=295069 RepID=A0A1H8DYN4_9FLAO|nr:hypothetical protein [Chryseobacterium taichungense]SEN12429.1 hypothetical protein SAMN05421856_1241 [Chryseobacterium taichungense]
MLEDAAIQNMWKIGGEWKNNGNGGFDYGKHTVGFDGSYSFSPDNVDINLPELVLNGYGSAKYWGGAIKYIQHQPWYSLQWYCSNAICLEQSCI